MPFPFPLFVLSVRYIRFMARGQFFRAIAPPRVNEGLLIRQRSFLSIIVAVSVSIRANVWFGSGLCVDEDEDHVGVRGGFKMGVFEGFICILKSRILVFWSNIY